MELNKKADSTKGDQVQGTWRAEVSQTLLSRRTTQGAPWVLACGTVPTDGFGLCYAMLSDVK